MDVTLASGLKPATAVLPKTVSVNGVVITRDAIAREAQNHPAATPALATRAAAHALVIRELLLQQARKSKANPEPLEDEEGRRETEDEALIRALIESDVKTPVADAATCKRYYHQNLSLFRSASITEVSHILIAAAPNDVNARDAAQKAATELTVVLAGSPDRFAELARTYSACPSRDLGGNLGQIGPGQTVAEFERALGGIAVGAISDRPMETRYGFHIVKIHRRDHGRQLPYELVEPRIAEYLTENVQRTAMKQYLAILIGQADIVGVDLAGAGSPLVQ